MKKTVGMMIKETMEEKNISLSTLGRGLCNKSDLSRYLNGTRRIDRLLLTVFLQRVGKSPAKFSMLLTQEEYTYFEWKHEICIAQMNSDWKQVEQLLREDKQPKYLINEILQKQYTQILYSIVEEKVYGNRVESVRLLQEAINITVPEFYKGLKSDTLLGTQEICAILLWQNLQTDKRKSRLILKELVMYLEMHYQDVQELIRVYPKVVAQYLLLLQHDKEYEMCLIFSEKVINLMIKTGYANDMERFLQIYIDAAEALGAEEKLIKRKKQLQAWKELMADIGCEEKDVEDELFLLDVWQEVELLNEAILISRQEHHYSQEGLSQNICEPETISRIEVGKSAPRPGIYKKIAKKLELPEEYYYTTIETDDFEALELQWLLENSIMRRQWDEAEDVLDKLRGMLNLEDKRNRQYVESKKYIIDSERGIISLEYQVRYLLNLLQLTIPNVYEGCWSEEKFWKHYFRKTEMSILINLADVFLETKSYKEALNLLQYMYQYYKKRMVNYDLYFRTVLLVIARLSSAYLVCGYYKDALKCINEGIRISIVSGNKRLLSGLINNKAHALECMKQKEASLKYYKLAYYCADLMEANTAEISKQSYERLANELVRWY